MATIYNGVTSNNLTLGDGDKLWVYSGGRANYTTINSGGYMLVSSGGTAYSTIVSSGGSMAVSGWASSATLSGSLAKLFIYNGGFVSSANVNNGGLMYVSAGASARNVALAGKDTLTELSQLSIRGSVTNLGIGSGAVTNVYSGALVNNASSIYGQLTIEDGGKVSSATINSGGSIIVKTSGSVNSATVNSKGGLYISKYSNVTNIKENGGFVSVDSRATVTFVANTINNLTFSGQATLHSGTTASNGKVNTYSYLYIYSGGRAVNTNLTGTRSEIYLYSGGVASATTVNNGAKIFLSGGTIAGATINTGGEVKVDNTLGGTVDFNLNGRTTSSDYMINNLALVTGTPTYRITVSASQATGTYKLAAGASSFTGSMTVYVGSANGGSVTVNGSAQTYNSKNYELKKSSGNLTLVISNTPAVDTTPPTITPAANITAPTKNNVVVTATFTDNVGVTSKQYSLDNKTWTNYTTGIPMTANGTVYFKASDAKGNTATAQYKVSNIDKTAPTIAVSANITTPTKGNVKVTATFADNVGVVTKQYRVTAGSWTNYTEPLTISTNTTIDFKAVDAAGNEKTAQYVVSNIDKTAPTITTSASTTAATTDPVVVSATFADNKAIAGKQYKINSGNWTNYTSGVTMTANGVVYFKATDTAGNATEAQYTVSNITNDNWGDLKAMGAASDKFNKLGAVTKASQKLVTNGKLSASDTVDYYQITLTKAAKISFTVKSGTAGKFTIYQLTGSAGNYSLKSLQSTALKKNTAATTKDLLLKAGTYYFSVTDTDKKASTYTVSTGSKSVFYTKADNGFNNKINASVTSAGSNKGIKVSDWVGFTDAVDYYSFTLTSAAKMIFSVKAGDTGKFTIYNKSKKALQTTSLKKGGTVNTKELLLGKGTYYFSVTSANAAKGVSAAYTVSVNSKSVLYTKADNGFNNKLSASVDFAGSDKSVQVSDWVGFSDAVDYYSFKLTSAAKMVFTVKAGNAAKFVIYNASGKALQTTDLKKNAAVSTKALLMKAGTYYFSVTSTTASKGASVAYTVSSAKSTIYPAATTNDNSWSQAQALAPLYADDTFSGWVGYGDTKDFCKFEKAAGGKLKLTFDKATASEISKKELKLSVLDSNGKEVKMMASKDYWTSSLSLGAGTYYIGAICADASKFDSKYNIKLS